MARILLIDDDPSVRNIVRLMLMRMGHEVVELPDGSAIADGSFKLDVHLVISDIVMANVDGLETIKLLRARRPNLKVIAMSGGNMDSKTPGKHLKYASMVGADWTLAKPFDPELFRATVNEALGKGRFADADIGPGTQNAVAS